MANSFLPVCRPLVLGLLVLVLVLVLVRINNGRTEKEGNNNFNTDLIPGYADLWTSFQHVYVLAFGDFDTDSYELGDGS